MCNKQMRQAFITSSGIPYSNRDLLQSPAYSGGKDLFISCTGRRLSKLLFPALWNITISPYEQVVIGNPALQTGIEADRKARAQAARLEAGLSEELDDGDPAEKAFRVVPMLNLTDHKNFYQSHRQKSGHSPHGFPFTLGVGGFLYVERRGEEHCNDPRQFVLEDKSESDAGMWTPPSGLASEDPFVAMCRSISRETGLVVLDDEKRTATIVVPKFTVTGPRYEFLKGTFDKFDGTPLKQAQTQNIQIELERAGKGDYKILFRRFEARLLENNLPPQDKVDLSYPEKEGMRDREFMAFVTKAKTGCINIHLPFSVNLPQAAQLLTIDCEGSGRATGLKTQDELLELQRHKEGSRVVDALSDLLERPFKLSYIPGRYQPISAVSPPAVFKTTQPG
jgi:hypothetical protein